MMAVFDLPFLLAGLILILISASARTVKATMRGHIGEWAVAIPLKRQGAAIINVIIIPADRQGTTQIDHLVLTEAGITVLETKNYSGSLYSYGVDKDWVQYKARKKYPIHNPQGQNHGHVRALARLAPDIPLHNLVVLAGSGKFPKGAPADVFMIPQLARRLRTMGLDAAQIPAGYKRSWERIQAAVCRDRHSRKAHKLQVTGGGARYYGQVWAPVVMITGIALIVVGLH